VGYKILLADDSVTVQKIITLTFSDEGVDVLTVNNGDEAVNTLQYMRPALVMADVSIPGKNGYEICEFIKNHPELKNIPVILLVPAFEPFDEEKARRVGANHFLTKPFQSIRTLISTVKSLIEPGNRNIATGFQEGNLSANGEKEQNPDLTSSEVLNLMGAETESQSDYIETNGRSSEPENLLTITDQISSPEPSGAMIRESAQVVATESSLAGVAGDEEDSDHVLELDDVLADMWAELATRAVAATTAETKPAVTSAAESSESPQTISFTLPQEVIDEIVTRVVAEVTERLPEMLSRDLADRLAPEVVEIIKQQRLSYREPDALLELDEV
jgi:CheY-like chemotaxis protein